MHYAVPPMTSAVGLTSLPTSALRAPYAVGFAVLVAMSPSKAAGESGSVLLEAAAPSKAGGIEPITAGVEAGMEEPGFAVHELEDWTVTGRRPGSSSKVLTFPAATIDRIHPASADEVLRLVPGIHIVQHGSEGKGHQIFLRGFDAVHGSDVEVLLQGISLNEPSHVHGQGYLDLYGLIPEAVVEMEVARGPFLPWQGNFATAGSIRFRPGLTDQARPGLVRTEVDHRGKLRAAAVAGSEEGPEQSFAAIEGVLDPGFGPDRRARRAALMSGYQLDLDSHHALTALVSGQTARFHTPGALRFSDVQSGRHDFHDAYGPAGEGISDRLIARFGYQHGGERPDLDLFVYALARDFSLQENFTGFLLNPDLGDRKRQQQWTLSGGGGARLERVMPTPFPSRLFAGAGWRLDDGRQREQGIDSTGTPWSSIRGADFAVQQIEVYTGYRFSPWRWVELFPSLRLDLFVFDAKDRLLDREASRALLAVSPRVATAFPMTRAVTLLLSWGRGLRAPEARAMVAPEPETVEDEPLAQYTGGRPEITICDAVEAGVQIRIAEHTDVKLMGFGTFLDHEMVFDHLSNLNLMLDGTRRLGVELTGETRPVRWLTLALDFTWVDARFNRSGYPVPGAPQWLSGGRILAGKARGPRCGAQLLWVGTRPLAHGAETGGYFNLDLDAGWRWDSLEVAVAVHNPLDAEIMEGAYHYASWFDRDDPRSVIPKIHSVAGEPISARLILTFYP